MKASFGSAVLALIVSTAVVVSAQSLAELARQEEARRKAIKSPGKVYTNDSLRQEPPSSVRQVPAAPAPGAPSGPEQPRVATAPPVRDGAVVAAAGAEANKDEAYWRTRLQGARDALARAEVFAEALQTRINALSTDFVNRDDPAQRGVIAANREKALAEMDRVTREIAENTKLIADIQEEARRAGVPPGWLR
jgi:hypothetical protein